MSIDVTIAGTIENLGIIIGSELHALSTEYWMPRLAPDQSEGEMRFRKERITRLRAMREEFENFMFGLEKDALS